MSVLVPDCELVVRERRHDVRILVSLPGRYWIATGDDGRGEVRQFACRAINISAQAVALSVPVQGMIGQRTLAEIDQYGRLEGPIVRLLNNLGFVMRIDAGNELRDKLADKIDWLEKHKNFDVSDRRAQARFAPKHPHSTLL